MGVGEARRHQATGQVDDVEVASIKRAESTGIQHRDDLPVLDEQAVVGTVVVPVEDRAAGDQGPHQRPSSRGPAGSWVIPTFFAAIPESASRQTRFARYAVISAWS